MTEWALAGTAEHRKILAYPMINMPTVPSETFGPNREVMSSGGTADPTFHVTMYTLSDGGNRGNAELDLSNIPTVG